MTKTHRSSSKKNDRLLKKLKKSHANQSQEALLSNVCNVTGLDAVIGITDPGGDDLMDCLEEMATAQVVGMAPASPNVDAAALDSSESNNNAIAMDDTMTSNPPSPPPPGIHRIPNLRIELARHLHAQNLSIFLLQSCPGLRMPTFERWLLDSKLEETDRFQSVIEEWIGNPSAKLAHSEGKTKKKYGRAAMYDQISKGESAQEERENARRENDCKLLLGAENLIPAAQQDRHGHVGSWIRHVNRDPVLPYQVIEGDLSCDRLLKEVIAAMSARSEEEIDERLRLCKAREIVRELCHMASEACKELQQMEKRLGKYQKPRGGGGNKKRNRGGSSGGGDVDKVVVEWHNEDQLCSLMYVAKRRKSSREASTVGKRIKHDIMGGEAGENNPEAALTKYQHKPKPFIVKLNSTHYHKLRSMFDDSYDSSEMTKEQSKHAFHAVLFAIVIRYSSLSGGQQLNDFRGGGMQGAVHDTVFDCLSKHFGGSAFSGTECFASPFNSSLPCYFSAFPSPCIDGHFGSHGDFFHQPESMFLRDGMYELNPPFSPGVMNKMAHRIGELLGRACKEELDVTFVVIVPTVRSAINDIQYEKETKKKSKKKKKHSSDDGSHGESKNSVNNAVHHAANQSFCLMINSAYCRSHIILPAREHGYIEGGQHLRPTKFKESQLSTSVIVLRSKSLKGVNAEVFERELREAFASRHATEVEQRKAESKEDVA